MGLLRPVAGALTAVLLAPALVVVALDVIGEHQGADDSATAVVDLDSFTPAPAPSAAAQPRSTDSDPPISSTAPGPERTSTSTPTPTGISVTDDPSVPPVWSDPAATPSPTRGHDGARSQAEALDRVIAGLGPTRARVADALDDVLACGPGQDLARDAATLDTAAAARTTQAARVAALPMDAVPDGPRLTGLLTHALRASATADSDLARWARSVHPDECRPASVTDSPDYRAATDASKVATTSKRSFLAGWNVLSERYGLDKYEETDL